MKIVLLTKFRYPRKHVDLANESFIHRYIYPKLEKALKKRDKNTK